MQEHKVIERIKALSQSRGWSNYRLAKESGITYSTLCTMLNKAYAPSISTLIKICNGFGITLAQFFDDDFDNAAVTPEQREHLQLWEALSEENRTAAEKYLRFLLAEQKSTDKKPFFNHILSL